MPILIQKDLRTLTSHFGEKSLHCAFFHVLLSQWAKCACSQWSMAQIQHSQMDKIWPLAQCSQLKQWFAVMFSTLIFSICCCVQDGEEYNVRRCLKARSFNLALCISFTVVLLIFILTVLVIITLVREFYEYLLLWVSDVVVASFPDLLQFRLPQSPLFCTARDEKLGRAWEQG